MKLTNYLGDRPFWRDALKIALPVAIQNMLTTSFQLVDTLMVGQLGDVTLSAVGMAGQWSWLLGLVLFGICSGMSVLVSQYWGVKDMKGIHRSFGIALTSCLAVSALFMAVALALPNGVIRLFNQEPEVVRVGVSYLMIACFSYPALALTNVFSTLLRNTERAKLPMYLSILSTLLNAGLNYCLIFGRLGLPAMGAAGAALATVISSWVAPVLLWAVSFAQKNEMIAPLRELLGFRRADLALFWRKASPVALNETLWGLGIVTLNTIFANQGHEYYAAVTIQSTYMDIAFAFFVGLCNACVVMVGKSVGQGKISRAVLDAGRFVVLIPLSSAVLGVLTIVLRQPLVAVFNLRGTLSALTLSTTMWILVMRAAEFPLQVAPYGFVVGVFRSGGDTLTGAIFEFVCLWIFSLPLTWLAANIWHLPFVMIFAISKLAEDTPKLVMCLIHFCRKKWIRPVTPEGKAGLAAYLKSE